MEMLLRRMVFVLLLLLHGCAATYDLESPEKIFTKVESVSKLRMRNVEVVVNDNGNVELTPNNYENLSKNLSDIYTNQKLLKENIEFYERQMFDKEE